MTEAKEKKTTTVVPRNDTTPLASEADVEEEKNVLGDPL
jgi:hypothetical protein